jgi:hypothetical protein
MELGGVVMVELVLEPMEARGSLEVGVSFRRAGGA